MEKFKFLNKKDIKKLPKKPGVYCFSASAPKKSIWRIRRSSAKPSVGGKNREILYIGKAADIRERVKNHFSQPGFRENVFLEKTKEIGFIKTDSEIDALILEANLIKKCQPKYNVIWKDDKNYFYIAKTREDFPQIFITHQKKLEIGNWKLEIDFVGPFVDGRALKQTLKTLRKVFPYRTCKVLPKKPCLWYQLDRCLAPCLLKSNLGIQIPSASNRIKKESQKNVENIFKIIKGEKNQVVKKLEKEMKNASKFQAFEKAASVRDQIWSLKKIFSHFKILEQELEIEDWEKTEDKIKKILKTRKGLSRIEAYDVSNIQGQKATGAMVTFAYGKSDKNSYRKFKIKISGKPNDIAMLKEVLSRRFNHPEWPYPDLVLIDGGKAQLNAAVSEIKNRKIISAALAKKKNELYLKGRQPILVKNLPREIFNLFLQLRDEAHRFALTYHKKLREKGLIE
jgi:excinuclease ABC subunit C